jgi:hypothetical protein
VIMGDPTVRAALHPQIFRDQPAGGAGQPLTTAPSRFAGVHLGRAAHSTGGTASSGRSRSAR